LSNIRETDAIAEVVRIFEDENIIHVGNKIDPLFDIEIINLELVAADLQTVNKRLQTVGRDVKAGKKEAILENGLLERVKAALDDGKFASTVAPNEFEMPLLRGLHLLTSKPILYVLNKKGGGKNLDEMAATAASGGAAAPDPRWTALIQFMKDTNSSYVIVDARIEEELKDLDATDKANFRAELGGHDDGVNNLIKSSYDMLGLMTYFTTGEDESRAWTIHRGWTAPEAGTAIHTDFKDKFVKAEIIEWDKLLAAGSYAAARERGLVRTEGKTYIVKDGDVIEFKI